jgi:hypothetical protein
MPICGLGLAIRASARSHACAGASRRGAKVPRTDASTALTFQPKGGPRSTRPLPGIALTKVTMRRSSSVVWSFAGVAVLFACGGQSSQRPHGSGGDPRADAGAKSAGEGGQSGVARGGSTQGGSTQTGGTDDASIAGEAGAPSEAAAGGINALGGAPSGGGTTPSAGALNLPEVEFPAGCAELSRSGDAVSCNYEFACDSQTRFTGLQK